MVMATGREVVHGHGVVTWPRQKNEQSTLRPIVPRSSTIPPNGPKREDAKGKHEKAMIQKKGKSPSHLANSTNLAKLSSNTNFLWL
ncbi:hypothetical protein H5410_002677 [Solanum commersonii]|uniref:Uncharacterized protein n=1 Tax=Solanum commersonii TaxID=4109 RepID=A0A9J6B2U2_SOLCO|nr:hypothetical protein H5410_002677 [Solanum commersonii]